MINFEVSMLGQTNAMPCYAILSVVHATVPNDKRMAFRDAARNTFGVLCAVRCTVHALCRNSAALDPPSTSKCKVTVS